MKSLRILFGTLILGLFAFSSAQAQSPAVKIKENKGQTIVYEVAVDGADTPALAQYLDKKMKEKPGVVSAVTNAATGICTVEASPTTPVESFKSAVKGAGFTLREN